MKRSEKLAYEWANIARKGTHMSYSLEPYVAHHEVTDAHNPLHLQLRTHSEIWIKERMINLGVRHLLPRDWRYVAWVDADVFFRDPHWALETMHELQHVPILQPWKDCVDLGPDGTILEIHKSLGSLISHGVRRQKKPMEPYQFGHPGFAWACRREFWEAIQGMMDFAILGSGDHHAATAMLGEVYTSIHDKMSAGFKRRCQAWQFLAHRACGGRIGYLPGLIEHRFHGSKKKRYYRERWQILVDHGYDPETDITYDSQGLIQLVSKPGLESAIRAYNRSRQEDSIEI